MRTLLAFTLVASACNTAPPPAPAAPATPRPAPVVRAPSCADAGVLLRGNVSDEAADGKRKEALIARLCTTEAWDAKVLACVASSPTPTTCLGGLTPAQVASYEVAIAPWQETDPENLDDPPPPEEEVEWIACEDAVKHTEIWLPPITVTGDDRPFAAGLRAREMIKLCNVGEWSAEVRACLAAATEKTTVVCITELEPAQQRAIATKLAEADKLVAKAVALAARPAKVGCKQVVAAHYSDARWRSEVPQVKGASRKKLIDESRKRMAKACTGESWPIAERACIVGDGGDACFGAAGRASRWGFPAAGVLVETGIAECDDYGQTLVKVAACDKIPEGTRDSLLESYTMAAVYWLKADDRASVASACKAAGDAIRQSASSLGCAI